jgi:hypothetical protein
MKTHRAVATVLLAFLLGGSSAEVAVKTHRAFQHHRAQPAEGDGGDLVALELRDEEGAVIARPRVIAPHGRAAHLVLRDPSDPRRVRLTFRVEAIREPSGDVSLDYELGLPGEEPVAGRLCTTPGVEQALALGDRSMSVTLLTLPVPSRAFDAFLEAERRIRHT